MVPFQAAIIPLMETELFCSLDLGQTQGLTAALEARSQRMRRLYQPALWYLVLL